MEKYRLFKQSITITNQHIPIAQNLFDQSIKLRIQYCITNYIDLLNKEVLCIFRCFIGLCSLFFVSTFRYKYCLYMCLSACWGGGGMWGGGGGWGDMIFLRCKYVSFEVKFVTVNQIC